MTNLKVMATKLGWTAQSTKDFTKTGTATESEHLRWKTTLRTLATGPKTSSTAMASILGLMVDHTKETG
jgi:hypothetical protein